MSGIEQMLELMSRPSAPAPEGVYMIRPLAEAALEALEAKAPLSADVRDLRAVLAEPQEQLWAIHSVGPGEEFPCLNKEDAEKRAQELRGIGESLKQERIAKGESIEHWPDWIVNVIPSPWEPAEHFEIMAEEWAEDADQLREKATAIIAERDQLKAQNEALLKQVAALQSDANSWQTGYDEGRRIGAKTNLSEIDRLRPAAALHEQVQRAAGELPEGWEIKINIELWAGTVDLFHNGNPTEFESDAETMAGKIEDAIDTAKQEAQ